jgi:large subunit ribosomal protein L18
MTTAHLRLAVVGETMFPHVLPRREFARANSRLATNEGAPFFLRAGGGGGGGGPPPPPPHHPPRPGTGETGTGADARARRHKRIRGKIEGTAERPRLVVFRSNRGIFAQLVDDASGHTLAAASWTSLSGSTGSKSEQANAVGKALAEAAKKAGVERCVFDRGGYLFHGRVKALAEGAREGGLQF